MFYKIKKLIHLNSSKLKEHNSTNLPRIFLYFYKIAFFQQLNDLLIYYNT